MGGIIRIHEAISGILSKEQPFAFCHDSFRRFLSILTGLTLMPFSGLTHPFCLRLLSSLA